MLLHPPGVAVNKIVLSFDHSGESNATALFRRIDGDGQIGMRLYTTRQPEEARTAITSAYSYLVDHWQPGDDVYVFGAGSGAACAQAFARLLNTIGVHDSELSSYLLQTYALTRTERTAQDWQHIHQVAAGLAECDDIAVPVRFLGLWDCTRVRGTAGPVEVLAGRHAVAIDGGPMRQRVDGVDEVWFRGTHRDTTSGALTLEWMLDGAAAAGLRVDTMPSAHVEPEPSARPVGLRRLPDDAVVHASVGLHVRAHPQYWRRLPAQVRWADPDWLDRAERLVRTQPARPLPRPVLAVAS